MLKKNTNYTQHGGSIHYLMAFLAFQFRFDIDEKMALPVLLRGLSPTNNWARLKFAELNEKERKATQLQDPQVITVYCNIS